MGWKQWTRERLTSPEVQGFLQDQTVMVFDSAAQRADELLFPTSGMVSYLSDQDRHYGYTAEGAWVALSRYLGALSSYPVHVKVGDFFYSIPHQCHLVRTGSAVAWQQMEVPSVNGRAGVDNLTGVVGAAGMVLPDGFEVYAYGIERTYFWDRSGWQLLRGKVGAKVALTPATNWAEADTTLGRMHVRNLGNGMAHVDCFLRRTNIATPSFDATGRPNTTDDLLYLASLPAWYEPLDRVRLTGRGTGRTFFGFVEGGSIAVDAVHGDLAGIPIGGLAQLSGTYQLYHSAGMPV